MVLTVCRQVLRNPHDAQDAFQATFLVIARKMGSVHNSKSLASWLHGVALRVAVRAKVEEARRRVYERRCATLKQIEFERQAVRSEPCPELHEEIARLPQRYREPVVHCYLEGLTSEQAAVRIGCPPGTVYSRLSRARVRLRGSLVRRGVALPAAALAAGLTAPASAALPAMLRDATIRGSLGFAGRRAPEAAFTSAPAIRLAREVLCAMTISKVKILSAAALACALALGSAQTLILARSGGPRGRQEPAAAVTEGDASATTLSSSMDELESKLDETAPRNAEMPKGLQDVRAKQKAQIAGPRPLADAKAVTQFADVLKQQTARAVSEFAGVLKHHQPPRSPTDRDRYRVYILDLVDGGTTLIADESVPGLTCSGSPTWSHNGSRIVFDASPGSDWSRTRLMSIEVRDGRPTFTDLGPGNCPTLSPDDRRIAFLLNSGAQAGADPGVWVMAADGSQRRRAGEYGAPYWSADGREFLINSFADFPETTVMNFEKMTGGKLEVPGHRILKWPSWAGSGMLVSALNTEEQSDIIALLDVSKPAEAKIIEVLWQRGEELDVTPRWPVYSPETRRCIFIGIEPNKRTLYSLERGKSRRAKPLETTGQDEVIGFLALSPDGRYLLFSSNRP
jgi:RNA polymerase sigma factor (sigma-70 family)